MKTKTLVFLIVAVYFLMGMNHSTAQHSCGIAHHIETLRNDDRPGYNRSLIAYQAFIDRSIVRDRVMKSNSDVLCPNGITVLPVAFHVFHDSSEIGEGYNYSREDLVQVIDRLNADFSGYNAQKNNISHQFAMYEGGHTCIQFAIGKINRINTQELEGYQANATHTTLHKYLPGGYGVGSENDPNDYLNVYISDLTGGMLGMASSIPPLFGSANSDDDGVTISRDIVIPGKSRYYQYNKGSVLTHEIGHWLGLPHVNGDIRGNGCNADDGFSDTYPQIFQQFFDCGEASVPESCASVDNVFNFMDYSADCAKLMFTEQQVATMHAVLTTERSGLATSYSRGNGDQELYDVKCMASEARGNIFEYEIMDCFGEINFLEYQTKWYPSFYNKENPTAGLTKFSWTEEIIGHDTTVVSAKEYSKKMIAHQKEAFTDIHVFKLYMQCWNPYKKQYSEKVYGGKLMAVLKKCQTPENDSIPNAYALATNQSCHDQTYTLSYATTTDSAAVANCTIDTTVNDVWFTTEVRSNTGMTIEVLGQENMGTNPVMEAYVMMDSALTCIDISTASTIEISGDYAGSQLYVRVYSVNDDIKLFSICAKESNLKNDTYSTAIPLHVSDQCTHPAIYSNAGATASGFPNNKSLCGRNNRGADVWFTAVVPSTEQLIVETSQVDRGVKEIIMEAYVMIDSVMTPVACSSIKEYWPSYDRHALIEVIGQPAGTVVYLRAFANGSVKEGDFAICAYGGESSASCRVHLVETVEQSECQGESNTYAQTLRVHYRSDSSQQYIYVNNQKFEMTGSPQLITLTELPAHGRTVNVSVNIGNNAQESCWKQSFYKTYDLFTAPDGCYQSSLENDECDGAIELTVGNECHSTLHSSVGATYSRDASTYFSCGVSGFRPSDVWFKVAVPETGTVTISAPLLFNENNMILEAYSGSCDDMTLVGCDQFGGQDGSEIVLEDREPGEWIYIRVADQGNNTQGDFAMCVYDHAPVTGMYTGHKASDDITIYEADAPAHHEEISTTSISVYPNPTVDYINVTVPADEEVTDIMIYSVSGQLMLAQKADAYRTTLDVSSFANGLYFVKLRSNNEVETLMIEKL